MFNKLIEKIDNKNMSKVYLFKNNIIFDKNKQNLIILKHKNFDREYVKHYIDDEEKKYTIIKDYFIFLKDDIDAFKIAIKHFKHSTYLKNKINFSYFDEYLKNNTSFDKKINDIDLNSFILSKTFSDTLDLNLIFESYDDKYVKFGIKNTCKYIKSSNLNEEDNISQKIDEINFFSLCFGIDPSNLEIISTCEEDDNFFIIQKVPKYDIFIKRIYHNPDNFEFKIYYDSNKKGLVDIVNKNILKDFPVGIQWNKLYDKFIESKKNQLQIVKNVRVDSLFENGIKTKYLDIIGRVYEEDDKIVFGYLAIGKPYIKKIYLS